MEIRFVDIDSLSGYEKNSKTHSDAQVSQLAASIKEFGFTNPVLVDADGGVIAGHGRILAARKLKLAEVPCIRLSHLSETQKRAYVIADNKLALNAGWDEELLESELQSLHGDLFGMDLLGFSAQELELSMGIELDAPASSTKEIDPDDYKMGCKCPKCGFEFDDK